MDALRSVVSTQAQPALDALDPAKLAAHVEHREHVPPRGVDPHGVESPRGRPGRAGCPRAPQLPRTARQQPQRGGARVRTARSDDVEPDGSVRRHRCRLDLLQEVEAVLLPARSPARGGTPFDRPGVRPSHLAIHMERQVDGGGPRRLERDAIDDAGSVEDDRAHADDVRREPRGRGDAAVRALGHDAEQEPVAAWLRRAVDERRLMRERTPVPVQRALDVRARAHVVEPARRAVEREQLESVGMSVPAARSPVVQPDPQPPGIAPEDREALIRQMDAARSPRLGMRSLGSCEEQRAPAEVRARQRGGGFVALALGGRAPAAGVARGRGLVVEAAERRRETHVVAARESELARFGVAPLPQRDRVLRVAPRRQREVRQRDEERCGEARTESRVERPVERHARRLGERRCRTRGRDARTDDSSRPRTSCRRRGARGAAARRRRPDRRRRSRRRRRRPACATRRAARRRSRPAGWSPAPGTRRSARALRLDDALPHACREVACARSRVAGPSAISSASSATQSCSSQIDSR